MSNEARDEQELDQRVRALARDYNTPGPAPRERMWAAIQAGRKHRRRAARPSDRLRFRPADSSAARPSRWLAWVTGVAALLALGIGLGRFSMLESGAPTAAPTAEPVATTPREVARPNTALALATTHHLSRAETFLTTFRLGGSDTLFASQARDLLSSTRLLLDSRAVADPRTMTLLEDLELILIQIVQLGATDGGAEIELITDGLEQRQVIPRLRTAIPAGPPRIAGAS